MPGIITTRCGNPIRKEEYQDLSSEEIRDWTKIRIQKLIKGED